MLKGFKTILASVALIVIGVLEQLDVTELVGEQWTGLALAGIGVVVAALRMVTTTPVGTGE